MSSLYLMAIIAPKELLCKKDKPNGLLEDIQSTIFDGKPTCMIDNSDFTYRYYFVDSEIFNVDAYIANIQKGAAIIYASVPSVCNGDSIGWECLSKNKKALEVCVKQFARSKECFYDIRLCLKEERK